MLFINPLQINYGLLFTNHYCLFSVVKCLLTRNPVTSWNESTVSRVLRLEPETSPNPLKSSEGRVKSSTTTDWERVFGGWESQSLGEERRGQRWKEETTDGGGKGHPFFIGPLGTLVPSLTRPCRSTTSGNLRNPASLENPGGWETRLISTSGSSTGFPGTGEWVWQVFERTSVGVVLKAFKLHVNRSTRGRRYFRILLLNYLKPPGICKVKKRLFILIL